MNRIALFAIASCALALTTPAAAQDKKVNIAVVDVASIFEKYAMTKDLESQFDERRKAMAAEAESKRASIEAKRKSLLTFKPESKEFRDLEDEVMKAESDYETWAGYSEKKLKAEHKQWLLRIYKNVRAVTAEVAKRGSIDLVLTYDQLSEDAPDSMALRQQILLQKILYFDDRIDLTPAVVTELNQKYEKDGGVSSLRMGSARPTTQPADSALTLIPDADINPSPRE